MGPVELVVVAVVVVVPLVAIVLVTSKMRLAEPEGFARIHGVQVTEANRPLIAAYLRRGAQWRVTGAALGAALPLGTQIPGVEMLGGYLAGALAAELTQHRLRRTGAAVASLTPRTVDDYVAPGLLRAMRAAALAAVALVPLYVVLPHRAALAERPQLALAAGLAVLAVAVVEVVLRLVVRKPQPTAGADLVEADDAMRAASMHAGAGAGLAIVLLLLATQVWSFASGSDVQVLRWAGPVLAGAATVAAFVVWARFGNDRPWRVRHDGGREVRV